MSHCTINTNTIHAFIDGQQVPLHQYNSSGFQTIDPYAIYVNGTTGTTISAEVRGVGINLMQGHPNIPNPSCGNGLNYFCVALDNPGVWAVPNNPAIIHIPPGPNYTGLGLYYYGAQEPGNINLLSHCEFIVRFKIIRESSSVCPIACKVQTVNLPSSRVQALINDIGHQYTLPGYNYTECSSISQANQATADAITKLILNNIQCDNPGVTVSLTYNGSSPKCVTLTITGSPIKFKYIKVGEVIYPINTTKC